jgi:hypothetical protein
MGAGTLVSTSTAADQEIYAHTVAGSALTVVFMSLGAAYTTYNATEAYLGFGRIQFDHGSGWVTEDCTPALINTDLDNNNPLIVRPLGLGKVLAVGEDVRGIATPMTATSIRWNFSVWGNYA